MIEPEELYTLVYEPCIYQINNYYNKKYKLKINL